MYQFLVCSVFLVVCAALPQVHQNAVSYSIPGHSASFVTSNTPTSSAISSSSSSPYLNTNLVSSFATPVFQTFGPIVNSYGYTINHGPRLIPPVVGHEGPVTNFQNVQSYQNRQDHQFTPIEEAHQLDQPQEYEHEHVFQEQEHPDIVDSQNFQPQNAPGPNAHPQNFDEPNFQPQQPSQHFQEPNMPTQNYPQAQGFDHAQPQPYEHGPAGPQTQNAPADQFYNNNFERNFDNVQKFPNQNQNPNYRDNRFENTNDQQNTRNFDNNFRPNNQFYNEQSKMEVKNMQ